MRRALRIKPSGRDGTSSLVFIHPEHHDGAVQPAQALRSIGRITRLALAVAHRDQPLRVDPLAHEVADDRLGTALGKSHVFVVVAFRRGMSLDDETARR